MIRSVIPTLLALALALPPMAGWFSATMPRHQLIQVPAMIILGACTAGGISRTRKPLIASQWGPALLILASGMILFWMIPRSIDLAANNWIADQVMHLSWFLAAATLALVLPRMHLMVSMALGTQAVAMMLAIGLVYTRYPGLICTAYNLQQQHYTGRVMLRAAPLLGLLLWTWGIRRAGSKG